MINLHLYMNAYDTDKIVSITLEENSWIQFRFVDGGSESCHYFHNQPEKALKEYNELMERYHLAVEARRVEREEKQKADQLKKEQEAREAFKETLF